tara:strand:- start:349 stop:828 length:480 start_codon:yes stop_codon:yes gene_type:complete
MINIIKNACTPAEAIELYNIHKKHGSQKLESVYWAHPLLNRLAVTAAESLNVELKLKRPSYIMLEEKSTGHPAHIDGCLLDYKANHMPWCNYSASILVSDPNWCSGGIVRFSTQIIRPADHYLNLYTWSSSPDTNETPEIHAVDPHNGCRVVCLFFFAV